MTDRFTVTGTAGSSTWTVRYYDAVSGGNNITDQVTGTGWTTASLVPGAYKQFRVEVVPGSTVAGGAVKHVLVKATSTGDATKKDMVKASTTVRIRYRPDMLMRNPGEVTWTGDDIYNTTGTDQTKAQTVATSKMAKYYLKVQNDGNVTDSFTITGTKGNSQWTVKYYDALSGGNDITDQVTGTGWTVSLAAGGTKQFRVEVTPGSGVASGTVKNVLVKATSTGDPTKKDAVKASTTAK
jgi:uncharacterized membrane protein